MTEAYTRRNLIEEGILPTLDTPTDYDVEGIADTIQARYGLVAPDSVEDYWDIVAAHALPEKPVELTPLDAFRAEIARVLAGTPIGQEAVIVHRGVRISIYGMSRVNQTLPQPATIHVIDQHGVIHDMSGADDWAPIYDLVTDLADDYEMDTEALMRAAVAHDQVVTQAMITLDRARSRRNHAVKQLVKRGVTKYRIAKETSLTEAGVASIVKQ